jgi:hypothetical protein
MQDYLYNDIFGERPESIAQRSRNQEQLAALNKAIDCFFQKNEMDTLMRGGDSAKPTNLRELQRAIGIESETRAPQDKTVAKRAETRVPEARSRFLDSVDRFVEQARQSARKGGCDAL